MIDAHIHSTFSPDSSASIDSIVANAKRARLQGVIVTDHNTLAHLDQLTAVRAAGLETLEAIEWATELDGTSLHLLCYARSFDRAVLEPLLATTRAELTQRTIALAQAVARTLNLAIDLDLFIETRGEQSYLRRHDVVEVVAQRTGLNVPDAKAQVVQIELALGSLSLSLQSQAVIEAVGAAGGVAVLAHPGAYRRSGFEPAQHRAWIEACLPLLAAAGLAGLETRSVYHDAETVRWARVLAESRQLISTAGSDWHGGRWTGEVPIGTNGLSELEWQALKAAVGFKERA